MIVENEKETHIKNITDPFQDESPRRIFTLHDEYFLKIKSIAVEELGTSNIEFTSIGPSEHNIKSKFFKQKHILSGSIYVKIIITPETKTKYMYFCVKNDQNNYAVGWFFVKKTRFKVFREIQRIKKERPLPILDKNTFDIFIKNSITFLKNRRKFKELGVIPKKGIILSGPPGNGKSMLLGWFAAQCYSKYDIHYVSTENILEAFKNGALSTFFSRVTYPIKPVSIYIFDDFDMSFFDRNGPKSEIASCLLTAMDGVNKKVQCSLKIFSTNEKAINLDPAFCRPGRIDLNVLIDKPNIGLRKQFIERWNPKILDKIDANYISERTKDFSFAELELVKTNIVSEIISENKININKILLDIRERVSEVNKKKFVGFCEESDGKPVTFQNVDIHGVHI